MNIREIPKGGSSLSTDRALRKLVQQLQSIRLHNEMHAKLRWRDYRQFIPMPYPLTHVLTVCLFVLVVVALSFQTSLYSTIVWEVLAIALLLTSSAITIMASIRRLEGHSSVTLTALAQIIDFINYLRTHDFPRIYAPLHLPHSLSYNLQMTYRDGALTNVPVSLLVEGDIINLRPGQTICCDCVLLNDDDYSTRYSTGEVFLPQLDKDCTNRNPFPSLHYMGKTYLAVVTACPAIEQIKNILKQKASNQKTQIQSTSPFTFLRGSVFCSLVVAAVFFVLGILVTATRNAIHNKAIPSSSMVLWVIAMSVFLLITAISLFVPLVWILTLGLGAKHLSKYARSCAFPDGASFTSHESPLRRLAATIKYVLVAPDARMEQLLLHLGRISRMCFVDKKGIISLPIPTPEKLFFFRERQSRRNKTLRTRSFGPHNIGPSKELLITAPVVSSSFNAPRNPFDPRYQLFQRPTETISGKPLGRRNSVQNSACVSEVLNISASPDSLYMPHFESLKWGRYLDCLKPIGLNLLLNNCQPLTREHYAVFADHLTLITAASRQHFARDESQSEGEAVAVVNNRCLCGLAYEMGFRQAALRHYSLAASLGIYKAIEKSSNSPSKPSAFVNREDERAVYFRSQALRIQEAYASVPKDSSNEPTPVPNCFCTVYRDALSCGYQVMTQGSGDLITALCTNFWGGRDLLPLTDAERSKMLDFYNLNVSTNYCLAFAYMPLLQSTPLIHDKRLEGELAARAPFPILKLPVNFELRSRLTTRTYSRMSEVAFGSRESLLPFPRQRPVSSSSRKISGANRQRKMRSTLPRIAFSCGSLPRLSCQSNSTTSETSVGVAAAGATASLEFAIDPAALQEAFSKQTFLGMVSLQYQAMPGIEETIRNLNQACIRFVHFSQDNQLRSRVFAERLGLEADWNCHISLADPPPAAAAKSARPAQSSRPSAKSVTDSAITSVSRRLGNLVKQGGAKIFKQSYSLSSPNVTRSGPCFKKPMSGTGSSSSAALIESDANGSGGAIWIGFDRASGDGASTPAKRTVPMAEAEEDPHLPSSSLSSSASTSSISTKSMDQSSRDGVDERLMEEDAYNYVFANKSRLPSGIRNIRSHLENVDNVPLKVSLFTDCSPSAVDEMLRIMQEYDETVCVVGSCLSMANAELFCRGDTAIALFPMLPRVCGHASTPAGAYGVTTADPVELPLLSLAGRLVALGAALISRASLLELDVVRLISQAHASVNNMQLCIIFATAASFASALFYLLSLALLPAFPVQFQLATSSDGSQSASDLLWLPPVLLGAVLGRSGVVAYMAIGGRLLWLSMCVIPFLAASIFGRTVEHRRPLQEPPVKRKEIFSHKRIMRLLWVTAARFLPSVAVCWAVGFVQAVITCPTNSIDRRLTCLSQAESVVNATASELPEYASVLLDVSLAQEVPFFLLVTYLVLISFSYANAGQWIHQWRLRTNVPWFIVAVCIFVSHSIYLSVTIVHDGVILSAEQLHRLLITLGCGLMWCPILLLVNEAINWKERLLMNAENRFAKLFFETKLGMYSPV